MATGVDRHMSRIRWPFVRRSTFEKLLAEHYRLNLTAMEQLAAMEKLRQDFNKWIEKYHPEANKPKLPENVVQFKDFKK